MLNKLTPEIHIFVSDSLAEDKDESFIISSLYNDFKLSIPDSKEIFDHVVRMRKEAIGRAVERPTANIRISTINPFLEQIKTKSNKFIVDSREVKIIFSMDKPEVVFLDNLFSDEECDHLINVSKVNLSKSTVAVHGQGTSELSDYRTSDSTSIHKYQDDIVRGIEERISKVFNWNNFDTDDIQVLRYEVGQQYKPHYDFFADGSSFVVGHGERIATLILYLEEPTKGGETYFPDINLRVHCKKGSALFFAYPNPVPDSQTLHAGSPVIEGTKWIATKWFRSLDKQV